MTTQRVDLYRATPTLAGSVNTVHIISQAVTGPPGADGAGVSVALKEGGTTKVAVATVVDFTAADFDVTTGGVVSLAVTPDPAGTAATAVSNHVAAGDPHTQYALESALGTAAYTASTAYATAAQGATADAAVPATRTISTSTPLAGGGALSGNLTLTVGAASDTASGVVELATTAEVVTGTDTARAVTPAGAAATYAPLAQAFNAQTGTTYTLAASDAGKCVSLSNGSAITLTLPQDSDATISVGVTVDLYQLGAGQVTVAAGTGATLRTSGLTAKARAQYSRLAVQKVSANTWSLFGDLAAS